MAVTALLERTHSFGQSKWSWFLLALSSTGLTCAALYFQHVLDLQPCIKCIYQRTAVLGILLAALIPLVVNTFATRLLALLIWGYSAFEGLMASRAHLEIIFAENPFFMVCDIVPNFPSFMPLHEWLPSIFAATGDCDENSWQFLGMGMASWLQVIFIAHLVVLIWVFISLFFKPKQSA